MVTSPWAVKVAVPGRLEDSGDDAGVDGIRPCRDVDSPELTDTPDSLQNESGRSGTRLGKRLSFTRLLEEGDMSKEDERRILVVADETVVGAELPREIVEKARGLDAEVRVVFPALNTRLRHYMSDVDPARKEAESRLERSLEDLGKEGIAARGELGDSDPVQALQDALATGGADEVIIATRSPSRVNWLEKDIVERARKVSDLPITYVQGKSRSRES